MMILGAYFGAGTTYPKLVPESFYTGGTANDQNPGTNIRDPPKITKVEVPDGMNICFFELWGADSVFMEEENIKVSIMIVIKGS